MTRTLSTLLLSALLAAVASAGAADFTVIQKDRAFSIKQLTVKVGDETRTVVAGIAEQYEPEPLVGRKVIIVANLQPATLMGVESNGMVLAASHEGTVSLLTLDKDVPPGSTVT